jgi:hypothetical protein
MLVTVVKASSWNLANWPPGGFLFAIAMAYDDERWSEGEKW